jgi:hypothetical protein
MRRQGISGHVWNGQMRLKSVAPRTHASSEEVTVSVIFRARSSSGADDRESVALENAAGPANVKLSLARHSADRQARTRATRFVITAVNRYGSRPGPTSCLVRDHARVTSRRWDEDARGGVESRRQWLKRGLRGAGVKAEARRTAGRSEVQSLDAGEHWPTLRGRPRPTSSESHGWEPMTTTVIQ